MAEWRVYEADTPQCNGCGMRMPSARYRCGQGTDAVALEICDKEYKERLRMHDYCGDTVAWNIGGAIKGLPCADVAPVVRCKDCKYYYECGVNFCDRLGMDCPGDSDFFCSYGERKEGPHDRLQKDL